MTAARHFRAVANAAQHLLLHHEMPNVEAKVATGSPLPRTSNRVHSYRAEDKKPHAHEAFPPRCTRSKSAGEISTKWEGGSTAATAWRATSP
jgi:hypothetical protein